jgi:transcriptional regulator with PAS, ATPase and Fis domain
MHLSASYQGNLPRTMGYSASDRSKLPPEEVIFGLTPALSTIRERIQKIAPTDIPVVITGESGTGKDAIAHLIHNYSSVAGRPFVQVNCAAIPSTLIESELFGYEKGSFTGAVGSKPGRVELANSGTLFLDEIGELDPGIQAKLLQLLQDGQFSRIGGQEDKKVNVRFVFATNRDLEEEIQAGTFREDLYYRINVIPISLPPLRERREDIALLAEHFVAKYTEQMGKSISGISHEAMELLLAYDWPGNIRELENVMERAVALEPTPAILPDSLPTTVRGETVRPSAASVAAGEHLPEAGFDLEAHVKEIERGYIAEALKRAGGVQVKAAELLGMSFRSFRYYVKKYNLR